MELSEAVRYTQQQVQPARTTHTERVGLTQPRNRDVRTNRWEEQIEPLPARWDGSAGSSSQLTGVVTEL
ncbi:MAG: hypothetical protein ACI8Y4_003990 [Candidatus Poriferisodalaceae bacterium]|jgi:hypothetical protein